MFTLIGNAIQKRPWIVISIVLMITIGFSSLIPSLKMETSTEEFMPDDEIVNANQRVLEYFGQTGQIIMIFVENQKAQNVVTPKALKEQYRILKNLEEFDEITGSISITSFIDLICQLEFGNTLINCSDSQIITAYNDIMITLQTKEITMLQLDDPNEKIDFNPFPKLSEGKNIDSLDIKNYHIKKTNETFLFTLEVYNLTAFKEKITSPHWKINTWEWYITFKNLIIPDERLNMEYRITAHIEPTQPLWEIGKGLINNIKALLNTILNRQLRNSYKNQVYLWIKAPYQNISFPLVLETGNIIFNTEANTIEIEVNKDELGKYGIAPKFEGFELPAKIGNTKAGVRIFQTPIFHQPWSRVTINISFIKKLIDAIQNKPVINAISTRILSQFGDFSWEDFDTLFEMLKTDDFSKENLSLKDIDERWVTLDEAPDKDKSETIYYIKPPFIEDLKTSSRMFLSTDVEDDDGPSSTLMIVQLDDEVKPRDAGEVSKGIVSALEDFDAQENYVSVKATGDGVISNEMNEVTQEANMIIMPAVFIVICLILLLMFKRFSYVILPLLSLSISIIWLFGTMVLFNISFNMMMVALVPLLMGLGVDYSVHLFHNYRSELGKGKSPGRAIVTSIRDVGMAMFLASVTTVIAFLSFLSASIPPLRYFGILCALGIIYTFITTITLQASVRYVIDRRKTVVIQSTRNNISLRNVMGRFASLILKQRMVILLIAVIITVILAVGAIQVETTFDMNDFLPEGNEAMELMIDVGEVFPFSSEYQEYILIEGDVASIATLRGIAQTLDNLMDDEYITKTPNGDPKETSILSIIRRAIRDNSTLISTFNINSNGIPKNDNDVDALYDYLYDHNTYKMNVRSVLHQKEDGYDATVMRISTSLSYSQDNTLDTNKQMGILYTDLNNDMVDYGDAAALVTGGISSMYKIMNSMTESQILSTTISILLAALVLIIVYKNPLLGFIAIIPVGISIIWIVGTIYFLGYSFNIMTIMVTSLTIGIGIDYAIHATQRFRLTADRTGDVKKAVITTIGHTGGALFIAALTTASGFGLLILAPMPPEQQFGLITALTIIYSYITSILILPPILMKWGKWRKDRKGFIISPKKN